MSKYILYRFRQFLYYSILMLAIVWLLLQIKENKIEKRLEQLIIIEEIKVPVKPLETPINTLDK